MASQKWTIDYSSDKRGLLLLNNGSDSGFGFVTEIKVPDHDDYADEHVLVSFLMSYVTYVRYWTY